MAKGWSGAMMRMVAVALVFVGCGLRVQAQQGGASSSSQQKPAAAAQSGAPGATPAPQESNPFPTDTANVPVMPSADSPGSFPSDAGADNAGNIALPSDNADPVRSPDDPGIAEATGQESGTSDSSSGLDQLQEMPPDTSRSHKKGEDAGIDAPFPHDGPKKNVDIGNYYLDTGDWQGALSRFESAMVEDPENPDVYWGLAEAQRHMGLFAQARANYARVAEYDPDSRHGKDARKLLKEPDIANAPAETAPSGKTP